MKVGGFSLKALMTLGQEQLTAIRNVIRIRNDRKSSNLGLQILCPQSLLVLILRPPGGSGDEKGSTVIYAHIFEF